MRLVLLILLLYLIKKIFSMFFSNQLNKNKNSNIIDAEFEELE
tara:strand:+ start:136 stop:264 length:129 start_codon:yes stop_codon:yes gene_type:complete